MMMIDIGSVVLDRRHGEPVEVRHVEFVPEMIDLFGQVVPAHKRYAIVFADGRWANDRMEDDLADASGDFGGNIRLDSCAGWCAARVGWRDRESAGDAGARSARRLDRELLRI
jgi:hypothetical protein